MTLTDPHNQLLAEKHGQKEYEEEFEVKNDGDHEICFHVTDNYFKIITFDFSLLDPTKNTAHRGCLFLFLYNNR